MKAHHNIKHLSQAAKGTTKELDGVIKALGGTYPPPPPSNPKTVVYYQNGTIEELDLNGTITQQHFPDDENIIKIEIGTNVNEIELGFFYESFESLQELIIPSTVLTINSTSFYFGGPHESKITLTFLNRSKSDVMSMQDYSWEITNYLFEGDEIIFHCIDGNIVFNG